MEPIRNKTICYETMFLKGLKSNLSEYNRLRGHCWSDDYNQSAAIARCCAALCSDYSNQGGWRLVTAALQHGTASLQTISVQGGGGGGGWSHETGGDQSSAPPPAPVWLITSYPGPASISADNVLVTGQVSPGPRPPAS